MIRSLLLLAALLLPSIVYGQARWPYPNGRAYYRPQCNRSGCPMCYTHPYSIANQLAAQRTQQVSADPPKRIVRYEEVREPYRVRVCHGRGRACTYETRYRIVRKPVYAEDEVASTPDRVVDTILAALDLKEGEVFYDLGCGDGAVLKKAAKDYRCHVYGCDIDAKAAAKAIQVLKTSQPGVPWRIQTRDATKIQLDQADVVYVYQFDDVIEKIDWGSLKPGARVASYNHKVPQLGDPVTEQQCNIDGKDHVFYLYEPGRVLEFASIPMLELEVDVSSLRSSWGI